MSTQLSMEIDGAVPLTEAQVRLIVWDKQGDAMDTALRIVEAEWKRSAPVRTGNYRRSIGHYNYRFGDRVIGTVEATANYANWIERGTGVYGPFRRPIVPRTKKAMRFPDVATGAFTLAGRQRSGRRGNNARWVFAKEIRGQRGGWYALQARRITRPEVMLVFRRGGGNAVREIARRT